MFLKDWNMWVPCNKCTLCRIARSREWATRLTHESAFHDNNVFVTLTYNEEHLPKSMSISKDELQRFFKRLRRLTDVKLKYYACGEYGEKKGRPHYHAIVFGLGMSDKPLIEKAWPYGFIHVGTVEYDSARYVADYVGKKYSGKKCEEVYTSKGLEVPFQLCSRGLGERFVDMERDSLSTYLGCTIRGKDVGLPRYYKKKLGIPKEVLKEKANLVKEGTFNHYVKRVDDVEGLAMWKAICRARLQAGRNARARMSLRHRKEIEGLE